ncbi:MAG: ABC transporter permease, partial [Blastocatellia bacterium]|nr:ABC transporter permease [Blastocatellia bacterium]
MRRAAGICGILIFVMAITAWLDPKFISAFNLQNIARWTGLFGIITLGQAFVIIGGGIDLSIGSVVGLVGALLPFLLRTAGMPLWLALVTVSALSVAIGLAHGLLITKLKLQPFVVTLCGLFIYRGVARFITGDTTQGFGTEFSGLRYLATGAPISIPLPGVGWLSIPMPFIILILLATFAALLLNSTVFGTYLLALGRNEKAARFSGINT